MDVLRDTTSLLRPSWKDAAAAWGALVRANREQIERLREWETPPDFYAPIAAQFRGDPTREDDESLNALLEIARADDTWMDVGAGGGRFTLGLARAVKQVIAVEPSEGMREVLEETRREFGIDNVEVVAERWPPQASRQADVVSIMHVGYDIEAIGPFVEAMEASARRVCVALMLERSPATRFSELWESVHGEAPAALPALREFIVLLLARGVVPEVRMVGEQRWTFESMEQVERDATRRLWLMPGSAKHDRLRAMLPEMVTAAGDGTLASAIRNPVAMVTWTPHGAQRKT